MPDQERAVSLIRKMREMRDEIDRVDTFEALVGDGLLERARRLKHDIGDGFFHPDVLLAIVQLNVAAKNRFARLYAEEERRIMADSSRLLENEPAIERGLGGANSDLRDQLRRFKEFKREFDESRATSNVKASVIARLKSSMTSILNELDEQLLQPVEIPQSVIESADGVDRTEAIVNRFGEDSQLHDYIVRIVTALESCPSDATQDEMKSSPEVVPLRLEPWEISAYRALFRSDEKLDGEVEDLCLLYLRAAALRIRMDEEARDLSSYRDEMHLESGFLERVKESLDRAKELDVFFKDALQEGITYSNPTKLHRLYRSRLRLLRVFSGLWLVYDQQTSRST